jgi:twinkle protein
MELQESTWSEYKLPCPKCGGSDPVAKNKDGSAKCFSCGTFFSSYEEAIEGKVIQKNNNYKKGSTFLSSYTGVFGSLTDRGISETVAKKYGVRIVYNNSGEIAQHIYPYYNGNEIVGTKTRLVVDKDFRFHGTYEGTGLFGEQLYTTGGKYLTITEGECDALAVAELGIRSAVVSIKRGSAGAVKDIRESIEFVESFENVILCFDNDKAGRKAARQIARILKPGKTKILKLPDGYKDANDMLKNKKFAEFTKAWFEAKVYTPSGIIELSSKKSSWLNREIKESIAYPYEGLNRKLYGLRRGELVTLTGGTGLGKSSVTRELEHWLINKTEDNIGIIALEENWQRTADSIISIEANDRIYINEIRNKYTAEELSDLFDKSIPDGRVYIHAHLGVNNIDEIFSKLRYIIIGCECKWVIIDHLHMLVSALMDSDERRGIDVLMAKLRSLVEETNVGLILVSHLRRVGGDRGHERGVQVSLSHLKGSQAIAQLSDCVIALERNQQAEDITEANTTIVRILKSRYTGYTGYACSLLYNSETGRLIELTDEVTFENENTDDIPF